mmetsp:Transcript_1226/g.3580  ORF Transcript_1226/g.3580 Transcript_1226/m.3580 type:complete len:267 (+) Transcript_1226:35-835(+)
MRRVFLTLCVLAASALVLGVPASRSAQLGSRGSKARRELDSASRQRIARILSRTKNTSPMLLQVSALLLSDDAAATIDDIETLLNTAKQTIEDDMVAAETHHTDQLDALNSKLSTLNNALSSVTSQFNRANRSLSDAGEEEEGLRAEVASLAAAIAELEGSLSGDGLTDAERSDLEGQKTAKEAEQTEKQAALAEAEARVSALEEEVSTVDERRDTMQGMADDASQAVAAATSEHEQHKTNCEAQLADIASALQALEDVRASQTTA